ncbi:MAG TPA: tRNA-dihydrouridine synthase [Spirochaetia bacterium]|nr:tRNA-dihydrouridine synthase [Spirochaetia bacterium]
MEKALGIWGSLGRPFSVLAPMEDVTDTVFRRIVREAGAPDVLVTEFTSADGLCSVARSRVIGRLRFTEEERPLIAQIWGTHPENFRRVAAEVREMGFDGVDINMGCPVRKIIKGGGCGALIGNPRLAGELIAAAREGAGDLPLSVKTRIGITKPVAEEWIGFLLDLGLDALTVHGRTVSQQSDGEADWDAVSLAVRLRNAAGLPTRIIGNGDVRTAEAFHRRAAETGADGIMIGRGVFENLFLFSAIRGTNGAEYSRLSPREKVLFFRRHVVFHRAMWGERGNFNVLKKFAKTYLRSFNGARDLIDAVMHTRSYAEALDVLDGWLTTREGSHGESRKPALEPVES